MSRTYRKKYVPLLGVEAQEYEEEKIAYSRFVEAYGITPEGFTWHTTDYKHKSGCMMIRFKKNITRDGNKAHGDIGAMINISRKKIKKRSVLRHDLQHELNNMRAGNIEWDGNLHTFSNLRRVERGFWCYDV